MTPTFPAPAPTPTLTPMPSRARTTLAAAGTAFSLAAGAVPVVLWPAPADYDGPLRQALAVLAGVLLLAAAVVCWTAAVRRR